MDNDNGKARANGGKAGGSGNLPQNQLDNKIERKLRAERNKNKNVWFGFSVFGLIGWSVAVPTLLGTLMGVWLDDYYPREHSWTLMLMLAGLATGCINAMYWLDVERNKISKLKGGK